MTVTTPGGFRAAGVAAGLKSSGAPDLALVVNDGPLDTAAGVFTTNRFPAAPVLWSRQVVSDGRLRAVVLNSGGANACTGPPGFADTHATAEHAARLLDVGCRRRRCVLHRTDRRPVVPRSAACGRGQGGRRPFAVRRPRCSGCHRGPLTRAQAGRPLRARGHRRWHGQGRRDARRPAWRPCSRWSTTDAVVDAADADTVLRDAVRTTFERVDSDGCLSTNDTVLMLASGASGVRPSPAELAVLVSGVCADLSAQLIEDAEGATKIVAIEVFGGGRGG